MVDFKEKLAANIAARKAAEAAAQADRTAAVDLLAQFIELMKPEIAALPSDRSRQLFFQILHAAAAKKLDPAPVCIFPAVAPLSSRTAPVKSSPGPGIELDTDDDEPNEEVIAALAIVERIIEKAEELPPEGFDYGESVSEKARSIAETIEERKTVTHGQLTALSNMEGGLDRWLERSR